MTQFEYYSHNKMSQVKKDFTPTLIKELKSFLVERMVDNMETKDLVEYVTDDLDDYFESLPDEQFINETKIIGMIVLTCSWRNRRYADCVQKGQKKRLPYSLSEGKDLDDYGSKVDALVDSMGVTDKEVSTHTDARLGLL